MLIAFALTYANMKSLPGPKKTAPDQPSDPSSPPNTSLRSNISARFQKLMRRFQINEGDPDEPSTLKRSIIAISNFFSSGSLKPVIIIGQEPVQLQDTTSLPSDEPDPPTTPNQPIAELETVAVPEPVASKSYGERSWRLLRGPSVKRVDSVLDYKQRSTHGSTVYVLPPRSKGDLLATSPFPLCGTSRF